MQAARSGKFLRFFSRGGSGEWDAVVPDAPVVIVIVVLLGTRIAKS